MFWLNVQCKVYIPQLPAWFTRLYYWFSTDCLYYWFSTDCFSGWTCSWLLCLRAYNVDKPPVIKTNKPVAVSLCGYFGKFKITTIKRRRTRVEEEADM